MKNDINNTQFLQYKRNQSFRLRTLLKIVYDALSEKGYNPVNQMVGYIMSGDPTYITSHNNARSLIMKVERDELVRRSFKNLYRKQLELDMRILGLDFGSKPWVSQ